MKRYIKAGTDGWNPESILSVLKSYEGDYHNKSTDWTGYVTIEQTKSDAAADNFAWEIQYHGTNRSSSDSTDITWEGGRVFILPNIGSVHLCNNMSEFRSGLRSEFSGMNRV